jgi:tRNA dimethylallyltransferase
VNPPRIVAIVGATATGKTEVGERVATALGGEVVCADSRQVFRELEIGTGKPTSAERAARPHHLFEALSIAPPPAGREPVTKDRGGAPRASAGWYAAAARAACSDIHARGRVPVLVGGSGLYLAAARRGLAPTPPVDPGIRSRLHAELAVEGAPALHARLAALDPATASRLDPRDRQRVTRALEVRESTGRPLSWWHAQRAAPAVEGDWRAFELAVPAARLRARIETRTRWMFEHGLVEETAALIASGCGTALARLRAVGYDEAAALLAGSLGYPEAVARTTLRTAQLAKRQRTWFRHQGDADAFDAEANDSADLARRVIAALGGDG